MDKPLKILKAITLKLSRVFCFCCQKSVISLVQRPSLEQKDFQNVRIPSLENPTIERQNGDDVGMDHMDMASNESYSGDHLISPSIPMDDDFIQWYEEYCKKVNHILAKDDLHILNAKQCRHLVKKLRHAVDWILMEINSSSRFEEFKIILKDVHRIVFKAFSLVEECGGEDLCVSAIFQLENEESFRELLLELECCFQATYMKIQPKDARTIINFGIASNEDVQLDRENFKKILKNPKIAMVSDMSSKLTKYLLERLENLDHVKGGELSTLKFANCGTVEKGKQLGEVGSDGSVYESKWLGLTCATKVLNNSEGPCDEKTMESFSTESNILACLNHSNLVKFMGMGKGDDGWPFLVMEKMDTSVKNLITKYTSGGLYSLSYDVLLDIIQQIASGMYYLHDMHVAHRDLKPGNILWNPLGEQEESVPSSNSFGSVKLTDFGISKIEVGSESFEPDNMGTSIYRAPEVLKNFSEGNANYFQADVYSFGITCAELLCGRLSFEQEHPTFFSRTLYEKVKAGLRPDLPSFCGELSTLIRECCAFNPSERPTFFEIWKRLETLKFNYLFGQEGLKSSICFSSKVHDAKPNGEHTKLFGVDEKVKEVQNVLQMVNSLGIIGMGGVGKSTVVQALLRAEEGNAKFNKRCFHYIGKLQGDEKCLQALQDILKKLGVDKELENLAHGQKELQKAFVKNNTLLILDDVWDSSHFNNIIPQDMFSSCPNSTLVVCSRNWDTIKDHVQEKFHLEPLQDGDLAMKLFTTHCFGEKANMPHPFLEVGSMIVEACKGLPLSLKVLGAFLHGKERLRSWERVLQRLKRGRSPQTGRFGDDWRIFEVLKISFDGLAEIERSMFLDICCFFLEDVYGRRLNVQCDCTNLLTYGESSLMKAFETLQHHLLVEVHDGFLHMHDHLRDMGREIVEWKADSQPSTVDKDMKYAGTRLQYPSASTFEQMKNKGFDFKSLEGILCQVPKGNTTLNDYLNEKTYPKLRIFLIQTEEEESFFDFKNLTHTTFLKIHGSQLQNLPKGVENMKSLKSLNLQCSQLRLLPKEMFNLPLTSLDLRRCSNLSALPATLGNLSSLTSLNLSKCWNLSILPSTLGNLSSLTLFDLSKCSQLSALPDALENLSSLTSFNLRKCWNLSTLPATLGNLSSLTSLNLSKCYHLSILPTTLGKLSSLKSLDVSCSKLSILPITLENLSSLTSLNLSWCSDLLTLPNALGSLFSLTSLDLERCSNLLTLPATLGNLSSLTSLNLSWCSKLLTLPDALGSLSSLTSLNLHECSKLSILPATLGNLSSLTSLDLSRCSQLSTLPDALGNLFSLTSFYCRRNLKLQTLPTTLGNLSSLTSLDLSECSNLLTLPDALGNLSSLTSLDLSECSNLLTLPDALGNLSSLTTLELHGCSKLSLLPATLGNLSSLTSLDLSWCSKLLTLPDAVGNLSSLTSLNLDECSKLLTLPPTLGNLFSLTSLILCGCSNLSTLPDALGNLFSLTSFYCRRNLKLQTLPTTLGNLSSLTSLYLGGCSNLLTLPDTLGNLSSLTDLNLIWCSKLSTLPATLGNLSSLTTFYMCGCSNLSTLPNTLGNLSSLTSLNLSECSKLSTLPDALGNLSSLTSLDLSGCSKLSTLPDALGNLSSLTSLNLNECSKLLTLPATLGNLSSLASLDLSGCTNLSTLPNALGNLSFLTILQLNGCSNLSTLPDALGNLSSLTYLYLNGCSNLSTLPDALGNLSFLTSLDLSACSNLSTLPDALGNLSSLTTLELRGCSKLSTLPPAVENLSSLISQKFYERVPIYRRRWQL